MSDPTATRDPSPELRASDRWLAAQVIPYNDDPTPPPPAPAPQSDTDAFREADRRVLRAQLDTLPTGHDLCGRGLVVGWSPDGLTRAVFPAWCGRWDCPRCATFKRRMWTARILEGNPDRWFTLPMLNDDAHPLALQAQVALRAWPKLKRLIRKRWGPFEYTRIIQVGKNGGFHFHVCYRGPYILQDWLSKAWAALTGSYVVHIAYLKNKGKIAKYVARYLARDAAATVALFPNNRIVTMSKGYLNRPERRAKPRCWEGWTFQYKIQGIEEVLREWDKELSDRCWVNSDASCWLFEVNPRPQAKARPRPRPPPEPTLFLPSAGR